MDTDLELAIERPVAGGRMIARHEGRIVFVAGAIPGERVRARVERSARGVMWAETLQILESSPFRRTLDHDPACGGQVYRHIDLVHQRQLKSDIITDAFRRVGKIHLEEPTPVEPSPEHGYRLRARLHVRNGRAGFFRTGTHVLCDAGATGQLLTATMRAVEQLLAGHPVLGATCDAILVAENVPATERVLHLAAREGVPDENLSGLDLPAGVTGLSADGAGGKATLPGTPFVTDTAADLFGDAPPVPADTRWRRRAPTFFQGNRYLTGALVRRVLEFVPAGHIADLYAGVGLFAVAIAARGGTVVAVEGDKDAAGDLAGNVESRGDAVRVVRRAVEAALSGLTRHRFDAVIVDPPRTGLSPEALTGIAALASPVLIYVSCDPPTLARDAARLLASGYTLGPLRAFDLFPNTPHVEVVAPFTRRRA
jgi:23S rRNA (uracil1939-C5)-methyltransferase